MTQERYYLLRISLEEIEPEIWRRFAVPADITLAKLHDVIQIVMGWQDNHLHQFRINENIYTKYPDTDFAFEEQHESHFYKLSQLITKKGSQFTYLYDYGDDWEHLITVEDTDYQPGLTKNSAVCIEGENACPPEDCGGPSGFSEFCKIIQDPNHEEYDSYLEWYKFLGYPDKQYDPKKYDLQRVNKSLAKLKVIRKKKSKG